jgi:DHA1 family tetracycline resistance protein-like MFS transporter
VLPHLIENFLHGHVAAAARWYTGFASVFMAMQFVFTPVQGALSDRYGRRPVILLSNLGLGLDFAMMALVNSLPLLFIGRVVSGITSASFSTANAYIADITPPQQRAQAFGMIGMAFGLGFIIAPFIGGHLGAIDVRLPFWAAVAMSLTNFCYGWFVLPESLPPERRTGRFDWSHANPVGSLALLRRYPQVLGIVGVLFLMALAHMVYPTTFVLYADYRFGWGPDMAGNTLALVGVLAAIVQGLLIKRIVGALGERRTLLFGLACGAVGFALYALAPTGYWFWAMMPVAALWGVATPAAQAMMTHAVDPREQGRLQGAVASLSSIAGILGALVFPSILAAVAGSGRHDVVAGATFWLAALIVAAGGLLAWRVSTHLPAVSTSTPTSTIEPAVVSDADEIVVQPATQRE